MWTIYLFKGEVVPVQRCLALAVTRVYCESDRKAKRKESQAQCIPHDETFGNPYQGGFLFDNVEQVQLRGEMELLADLAAYRRGSYLM